MNPIISILLPSLRPAELSKVIKEFAITNGDVNYEIIINADLGGSVKATNQALKEAKGKYVVYYSDDVYPTQNCLSNMIEFMDKQESPFLGAFKMVFDTGKEIGPFGAYGKLYACYGCISRELALELGGVFNSKFMYSWGDIDLSLKIWEMGGKVEICPDAIVKPKQIYDNLYKSHRNKYWEQDVNTFLDLWHDKLGEGIPRIHGEVNKRLYVN